MKKFGVHVEFEWIMVLFNHSYFLSKITSAIDPMRIVVSIISDSFKLDDLVVICTSNRGSVGWTK